MAIKPASWRGVFIFIVEAMAELKSRFETCRRFKRKFEHEVYVKSLKTIDATVKKWKEMDSVQDQCKGNAGRKKSACTPENQTKINSLITSDKKTSVRMLASAAGMKKAFVHDFLRKDLYCPSELVCITP